MSYRFRRLVAFIALESWASHAASCPIHLITLSRTPRCEDGTGPQADCKTSRSFVAGDDDEQARGGAEAPVPEFSVVFRFRAYSRRHETEPESISPQDVLRPGGRRARWLLRDGAVQRQSAVQRVAKIGILERGRSLGLVGLIYNTIYFVQSMMRSCPWCSCSCHFSCGVCGGCDIDLDKPQRCQRQISTSVY